MTLSLKIKWTGTLMRLFEQVKESDATITEDEFVNALLAYQLSSYKTTARDIEGKVQEMRKSAERMKNL